MLATGHYFRSGSWSLWLVKCWHHEFMIKRENELFGETRPTHPPNHLSIHPAAPTPSYPHHHHLLQSITQPSPNFKTECLANKEVIYPYQKKKKGTSRSKENNKSYSFQWGIFIISEQPDIDCLPPAPPPICRGRGSVAVPLWTAQAFVSQL